jgi:hypothetical protein
MCSARGSLEKKENTIDSIAVFFVNDRNCFMWGCFFLIEMTFRPAESRQARSAVLLGRSVDSLRSTDIALFVWVMLSLVYLANGTCK